MEMSLLRRVDSEAPPAEKPVPAYDAKLAEESEFALQLPAVGYIPIRNGTVQGKILEMQCSFRSQSL
jgi:hypothetical protein